MTSKYLRRQSRTIAASNDNRLGWFVAVAFIAGVYIGVIAEQLINFLLGIS